MTDNQSSDQLRALVAELHPRKPQEVMGQAANSNLVASVFKAAVGGFVLVVGATLVMFMTGFRHVEAEQTSAANSPADTSSAASATTDEATTGTSAGDDPTAAGTESNDSTATDAADTDSTGDAIEAMGIGKTKDPDSQPDALENRLDQILDGLE